MAKIDITKDPHRQRETNKYKFPIPSREFIIRHLEELGRPASYNHFLRVFDLKLPEEQEALRRRLLAMLRDGQLLSNRRGSYALAKQMALVRGCITVHKEGYGFLIPDDGSKHIFLAPSQLRSAFHGDKVLVSIATSDRRGRREGTIVEILEHCTDQIVGRYLEEVGIAFVVSSNKNIIQDILIPQGQAANAKPGDIVIADIVSYPNLRRQAVGQITEVLGKHMAPGMEIEIAIRSHSLPYKWPKAVLEEVRVLSESIAKNEYAKRNDRQNLPFVTIDGEDARDFDDAVYCTINPKGGWQLYVAIADVNHYVHPDTAIDREAMSRGNSVYFPRQVIPMLPEILSNDLCSLKPNVPRLAMICEMKIAKDGAIKSYNFYEAMINSHARLTYDQVLAMLEGKTDKRSALIPHLRNLFDVYKALRQQRYKRGALDFASSETRIIFSKGHKIKQIVPLEHIYTYEIIEECMLAANVCTAKFLAKNHMPVLYRVHAGPDEDKLENFRLFLKSLGLKLGGGDEPQPMDYARLLRQASGRSDTHLIQSILLRSMQQAIYAPENIGHFGLAYKAYTHFTSPIRRYPDLLNQRAIHHLLCCKKKEGYLYDNNMIQNFGEHCSMTERRADEATQEAIDWLKCEFMMDKIGKIYDGIISGVMNFGIFVELKNIYIEGLLHITALVNDYYKFDPLCYRLDGKRTGRSYRIGDPIRVLVARVNLDERQIDFELA